MTAVLATGRSEQATSRWVDLRGARITAAGCPSPARLTLWKANGATDVLTLQRADECPAWLADACAAEGLQWHPLPLSGRRLAHPDDAVALARLPHLVDLLSPGCSLVVHCSAGMHRTGLVLYVLMRHAGLDADEAIALLTQARALTAHELTRMTRRNGRLQDRAEAIFAEQSGAGGGSRAERLGVTPHRPA